MCRNRFLLLLLSLLSTHFLSSSCHSFIFPSFPFLLSVVLDVEVLSVLAGHNEHKRRKEYNCLLRIKRPDSVLFPSFSSLVYFLVKLIVSLVLFFVSYILFMFFPSLPFVMILIPSRQLFLRYKKMFLPASFEYWTIWIEVRYHQTSFPCFTKQNYRNPV